MVHLTTGWQELQCTPWQKDGRIWSKWQKEWHTLYGTCGKRSLAEGAEYNFGKGLVEVELTRYAATTNVTEPTSV